MMIRIVKAAVAMVLSTALSGCLVIPGKFDSTMSLKKDGSFSFTYKGEVVFQLPDEKILRQEAGKPTIWNNKMAVCYSDDSKSIDEMSGFNPNWKTKDLSIDYAGLNWAGDKKGTDAAAAAEAAKKAGEAATEAGKAVDKAAGKAVEKAADAAKEAAADAAATAADATAEEPYIEPTIRKCTKKEIAELKTEWTEKQAKEKKQAQELSDLMGRLIGMDPTRPDSMTRFAANLQKHADWKSVIYKGDGIFLVDYQHVGKIDQDFVFPILPEQQIIIPFVTIKRRADGAALVETPGYSLMSNGGLIGSMVAVSQSMAGVNPLEKAPYNPLKGIAGKFTLTTDGEVLTNNTSDGPTTSALGKVLKWQFREARDPAPTALIKLR